MRMPFISIVTVCYNSEKTIEKTIKSVLDQKFQDYEYLIIDGKSKDKTLEIIKKYEPLFNGRLKWISEPDKGIYDAMNKGIKNSKGTYIWLVNSDDYIEANALSLIHSIVTSSTEWIEVISGRIEYFNLINEKRKPFGYTPQISEREYRKKRMGICHPATIVHHNVYEKYGLFNPEFKIMGDVDWFLRAKDNNVKFKFIDEILSNMLEGGVSGQIDTKKRIHDWKILYKNHTNSVFEYWFFMIYRIITYYKHGRHE